MHEENGRPLQWNEKVAAYAATDAWFRYLPAGMEGKDTSRESAWREWYETVVRKSA